MVPIHRCWIFLAALAFCFQSPTHETGKNTVRTIATPDSGQIKNGIYRNLFFDLSYKLPFAWVDRTKDMVEPENQPKSLVLLSTFERPPEATGNTVNSAVVIAAEKLSFSGIKTAEDYFASIKELAEAKGFKAVNEPYAEPIGTKQVIRGDFSKPRGSLTMYQTSLATIQKGYALSCTVIAGSEDEIQQLIGRLAFGAGKQPR
jgi:hypothetical protein